MENAIQELALHPWQIWLGLALVAALLELLIPSFSFIFLAVGCLVASPLALALNWPWQLLGFGLVSLGSVFLFRPRLLNKLHTPRNFLSRAQTLYGEIGEVTEAIAGTSQHGRVSVAGHDWAAQSTTPLRVGAKVKIHGNDGIVLLVKEI